MDVRTALSLMTARFTTKEVPVGAVMQLWCGCLWRRGTNRVTGFQVNVTIVRRCGDDGCEAFQDEDWFNENARIVAAYDQLAIELQERFAEA